MLMILMLTPLKKYLPWSLAVLAGLGTSPALSAETTFTLATPRGATIEVISDKPNGAGQFPVVILASGTSYDARQPLQLELAKQLQQQGFAVLRFNWAYQVAAKGGQPSADRQAEIEDMQTVLHYARQQSWADQRHIIAAGKSLGSIIAWRVFAADPALESAILLTPACRNPPGLEVQYPRVSNETRPSLWLLGDKDPVCATHELYSYLGQQASPARISVVDGNHILATEDKQPAAAETLELAARIATRFAASVTGH